MLIFHSSVITWRDEDERLLVYPDDFRVIECCIRVAANQEIIRLQNWYFFSYSIISCHDR